MASSNERRSRRKGIPKWAYGAMAVGLLLAVSSIFFIRPLGRKYQDWRAVGLVEKANAKLEAGQIVKAYEHGAKAFDLSPQHPSVMRLMGQILMTTSTEKDRALYFFGQLVKEGEATVEDRVDLARCYFGTGQPSRAREIMEVLKTEAPNNSTVLSMLAEIERSQGDQRAAAKLMGRAATIKGNPKEELELALNQLRLGDSDARITAREKLLELADLDVPIGLQALENLAALAQRSLLTQSQLPKVIEGLAAHPDTTDRHLLLAEGLRIQMDPQLKPEIVKEAIRMRIGRPINELADFFAWLTSQGETAWVLDLVDGETATRHPETLGVYLNALAAEGRWDELDFFLRTEDLPLSDARKRLMRAQILHEQGVEKALVVQELSNAIRSAANSKDFQSVGAGIAFAERINAPEIVRTGLSIMEGSSQWRERALEGFYRLAQRDKDFEAMRETVDKILKDNPNNERFAILDTYFNLLVGDEIELSTSRAQQLSSAMPDLAPGRLLNVLAAFRAADFQKAVTIARTINPTELEPGWRAVLAGVIELGGQPREALEIAETLSRSVAPESLLPVERGFLELALGIRG